MGGCSIFIYFSAFLNVILLHFLQVSRGADIQRKEMDKSPCVDVDATDGDFNCDGATPAGPLGTGKKEFVLRDGYFFVPQGNGEIQVNYESWMVEV